MHVDLGGRREGRRAENGEVEIVNIGANCRGTNVVVVPPVLWFRTDARV